MTDNVTETGVKQVQFTTKLQFLQRDNGGVKHSPLQSGVSLACICILESDWLLKCMTQ